LNYFSHSLPFLDQPYFVAGTAMPDWIRVVDKRTRVRSKTVKSFLDQHVEKCSPTAIEFCHGILQHHTDDDWFHNTETFLAMNVRFAKELRERMGDDASMRAGFVGHISIELLLDAVLIERSPGGLAQYYRVLESLDHAVIESALEAILGRPVPNVSRLIRRFAIERFMYDYLDDRRLLRRLNQIMTRVNLPLLPDTLLHWLPEARQAVIENADRLLDAPGELLG
jgi:hypothetical protein